MTDTTVVPVARDLAGARAVVTGGTRGIGGATTRRLLAAGADVVAVARHDAPVPDGVRLVTVDLVAPDGPAAAAERALALLGEVDVLVNNAGRNTHVPDGVLAATDEDWQLNLDANLMSVVRLDRVLVPRMVARGQGSVVHVSSGAARAVPPNGIPYSAAKAALNAYSKGLADAVGEHGVRVNVVSPGMVASERFEEAMAGRSLSEVATQAGVALRRVGTVDEAAEVIAFLASPRASYLTGVEVPIDGGLLPML